MKRNQPMVMFAIPVTPHVHMKERIALPFPPNRIANGLKLNKVQPIHTICSPKIKLSILATYVNNYFIMKISVHLAVIRMHPASANFYLTLGLFLAYIKIKLYHIKAMRLIPYGLILLNAFSGWAVDPPAIGQLEQARQLFYASVADKKQIEPALSAFNELIRIRPEWEGRATVYIGALIALKGKHSTWPHNKWRWANRGLKIMDEGIARNPQDAEALFIHSSTCYFLPFFFNRGEDAQTKFRTLIRLLPDQQHEFDRRMLKNVLQFLSDHAHLNPDEQKVLHTLKNGLSLGSP